MLRPLSRVLGGAVLALGLVFTSLSPAVAGQTVTINGLHSGDAYGNSADGSGTAYDDWPYNNVLNVNSGGVVNGDGAQSATGNSVTISGGTSARPMSMNLTDAPVRACTITRSAHLISLGIQA